MARPSNQVRTSSYTSDFQVLGPHLLYFERHHLRQSTSEEIDVFANMWSFAWGYLEKNQLQVRDEDGHWISPSPGWWAIFIPPFSLMEWKISPGIFEWQGILSDLPPPQGLPNAPIASAWRPNSTVPSSAAELFEWIQNLEPVIPLGRQTLASTMATKTKKAIDLAFQKDISIHEIAQSLQYSHAVMTRTFKKDFGLTPLAYRNKLRINEATRLMLMGGQSVTQAGFSSGFGDLGRFNKQFRQQINAVPSQFRLETSSKTQPTATDET